MKSWSEHDFFKHKTYIFNFNNYENVLWPLLKIIVLLLLNVSSPLFYFVLYASHLFFYLISLKLFYCSPLFYIMSLSVIF